MPAPPAQVKVTDDINSRFMQVIERLGHTGYTMSKKLGTSEPIISNIRNGKNPPNIRLVQAMLTLFPEVNPDWLLTGSGRMFRGPGANPEVHQPHVSPKEDEDDSLTRLKRIESMLKRTAASQVERDVLVDESIAGLERKVKEMDKRFDEIKKALRPVR